MSEQTQHPKRRGKHLADNTPQWLLDYRAWESGLDRRQRKHYRALQIAAGISAVIILIWAVVQILVREPTIPNPDWPPSVSGNIDPDSSTIGNNGQPGADLPGTEEVHISRTDQRPGVFTVLVVGRDTVSGSTDTMILVTYDTVKNEAVAMSLPRDTMVNVSWNTKKLNTVFSYYKGSDRKTQIEKGMAALQNHVSKLTGITPNFYVCVEWDAVGELVDAIDGVTFDVPYNMDYDDPEQGLHIHQTKGVRRLNGDDAMQIIRWRKNNAGSAYGHIEIGDSGRMKIQQDFLMAVAKECLQLKNLWNIPDLAQVFADNVKTNLSIGNLIWFGQKAIGIDVDTGITFCTLPYTGYSRGTSYLLPDVTKLLKLVNDGLNPYERDIVKSDLEVLVLNKDGSLSVTSGKLADATLAEPPVVTKPDASTTVDPEQGGSQGEEPAESQPPSEEQPGTQPEPEVPPTADGEEGTAERPDQSAPVTDENGEDESVAEEENNPEDTEGTVSILPARPLPVQ